MSARHVWLAAFLLLDLRALPAFGSEVRVIDGDTIRIGSVSIRLWGIDAPERDQTCGGLEAGSMATAALSRIIGDRSVTCEAVDTDRYGRTVATCSVAGADIGGTMVRAGWAWDYARYSDNEYADEEDDARVNRRGVWAASCVPPWEWRRR